MTAVHLLLPPPLPPPLTLPSAVPLVTAVHHLSLTPPLRLSWPQSPSSYHHLSLPLRVFLSLTNGAAVMLQSAASYHHLPSRFLSLTHPLWLSWPQPPPPITIPPSILHS